MKKILYSIFALSLVLPVMASAATFSFAPSAGTFAPGETFSVAVFVNPSAGEEITTAKLSAIFSASGLEIISFTQADNWIPLAVPGSDLIDNVTGKLIKTGGFPARVSTSKQFGTITFKAKNEGVATLIVEGDSIMLDIANTDKYVASAGASFTIVAPTPISTPTPIATPTTDISTDLSGTVISPADTAPQESEEDTIAEEEAGTTTIEQQTQTAAVASAASADEDGASSNFLYYLVVALAVLTGVFAWRKWGSNFSK